MMADMQRLIDENNLISKEQQFANNRILGELSIIEKQRNLNESSFIDQQARHFSP